MITFQEHASLQHLNTFRIAARARVLTHIDSLEDLHELTQHHYFTESRRLILGGGSNILFTRDFDGLMIKVNITGKSVIEESDHHVLVSAGAGENWHAFVQHCIDQDWGGLENLSLIPGTVGAAPIQNIGAYGVELQKVIEYVDGVDLTSGVHRRLNREECQFGYRESVFKHLLRENFFISSITLRLTKKDHHLDTRYGAIQEVLDRNKITQPTIRDVGDAVIAIRRSKLPDPAVIGNAGSFFKNPTVRVEVADALRKDHPSMPSYPVDSQHVKIPAGWLIEQCGWKGKRMGHVGVHEQQALVLVNFGGAKGEEIFVLATKIQESVNKTFGVFLMTEVNII
jgi:UDP-N-acetylmuramate dehydrogenase